MVDACTESCYIFTGHLHPAHNYDSVSLRRILMLSLHDDCLA